jgi:hypothetical protein
MGLLPGVPSRSLERYQAVKNTITDWLRAQQIPFAAPAPLPSNEYGDASHPLAVGYRRLAEELLADPSFRAATLPATSEH